MKKKKEILERSQFEDKIKRTIEHPAIPTYDWMYELGLTSTQRDVYAYLFEHLRTAFIGERCISTEKMAEKMGITISQCNNITRLLHNKGLVYKRTEDKKTYYSLYPNLLN